MLDDWLDSKGAIKSIREIVLKKLEDDFCFFEYSLFGLPLLAYDSQNMPAEEKRKRVGDFYRGAELTDASIDCKLASLLNYLGVARIQPVLLFKLGQHR